MMTRRRRKAKQEVEEAKRQDMPSTDVLVLGIQEVDHNSFLWLCWFLEDLSQISPNQIDDERKGNGHPRQEHRDQWRKKEEKKTKRKKRNHPRLDGQPRQKNLRKTSRQSEKRENPCEANHAAQKQGEENIGRNGKWDGNAVPLFWHLVPPFFLSLPSLSLFLPPSFPPSCYPQKRRRRTNRAMQVWTGGWHPMWFHNTELLWRADRDAASGSKRESEAMKQMKTKKNETKRWWRSRRMRMKCWYEAKSTLEQLQAWRREKNELKRMRWESLLPLSASPQWSENERKRGKKKQEQGSRREQGGREQQLQERVEKLQEWEMQRKSWI